MIEKIKYSQYNKRFNVTYRFEQAIDKQFSNPKLIPTNDMNIIYYIKDKIEQLLKARGFTFINCSVVVFTEYDVHFYYMPGENSDDNFSIYEEDIDKINELEQEVINKIKELKEQEK